MRAKHVLRGTVDTVCAPEALSFGRTKAPKQAVRILIGGVTPCPCDHTIIKIYFYRIHSYRERARGRASSVSTDIETFGPSPRCCSPMQAVTLVAGATPKQTASPLPGFTFTRVKHHMSSLFALLLGKRN